MYPPPDRYTVYPMTTSIQPPDHNQAVKALLTENHLPAWDLLDSDVRLFGCWDDNGLRGVVGLEMHDQAALLRSLVVPAGERGKGLGAALVSHAEQFAARHGIDAIYLLTTTAAAFFERQGYGHASRQNAPATIAATRQFSHLCPSSSAFMTKSLAVPPRT